MSDLVVARLENGTEKTVSRGFAEAKGLEVLDEPTTNPDGSPRAATRTGGRRKKPKTSVSQKAAEKKAVTEPAADKKEQDQ